MKRYTMVFPDKLYADLMAIAKEDETTLIDVLRTLLERGVRFREETRDQDSEIVIRKKSKRIDERVVIIL